MRYRDEKKGFWKKAVLLLIIILLAVILMGDWTPKTEHVEKNITISVKK